MLNVKPDVESKSFECDTLVFILESARTKLNPDIRIVFNSLNFAM